MIDWSDIVALLSAISAFGIFILAWRKAPKENKQVETQTASTRIDTIARYEQQIARYVEEVDSLRCRLDAMEAAQRLQNGEIAELRAGVIVLIAQLESNGIAPVWRPKPKDATKDQSK